jgi:hypothetical protein
MMRTALIWIAAPLGALALTAPPYASAQNLLPFKVYAGQIASFDVTKGVNTIKVNDGFVSTGTVPVSPKGVYRIKPGQALALLYQGKPRGQTGVDFGNLVTGNYGKVIRKVDGQEVKMDNYLGVETRFEITWINKPHEDAYGISRKYKSKFNPPLPASDFDRADGIVLINSSDPLPALKVPAFAKDVNKVAGKTLTVYYLASPIDAEPVLTVEVDFAGVPTGSLSSAKAENAADQASSANAQKLRDERAQAQQQASEDRADAKKQKEDERAAAKEAKADARAEAAAERAKKRAEAAAARKIVP